MSLVHHPRELPVAPVPIARAAARPANRYDQLSLMNLTVNDFRGIRKAMRFNPDTNQDEVIISFVDAVRGLYVMAGLKCDNKGALKKLRSLEAKVSEGTPATPSKGNFMHFKFSGPGQRETPAGTFQQFLEIAAHLPGLPFDRLRKEQADIATRACNPPMPVERAANRYDQLGLMNLTVNDFRGIRKAMRFNSDTNQDEVIISFVDAVVGLYAMVGEECSQDKARKAIQRLVDPSLGGRSDWSDLQYFKFSGPGQRETPAGTFQQFLEVAAHLPGLPFDRLRKEQADIAVGAASGDLALADSVVDRHVQQPGLSALRDGPREAASESMQRLAVERSAQAAVLPFTPEMLVSPSFNFTSHGLDVEKYLNLRGQFLAQENERFDNEHKRKLEEQEKHQLALDKEHKRRMEEKELDSRLDIGKMRAEAELKLQQPRKRPKRVTMFDQHCSPSVHAEAVDAHFGKGVDRICGDCGKRSISVFCHSVKINGWTPDSNVPLQTQHLHFSCGCPSEATDLHKVRKTDTNRAALWIMRNGLDTQGQCCLCLDDKRRIHLWGTWDIAHDLAHCEGGTTHPDNLGIAHPECNNRQGTGRFQIKQQQHVDKATAEMLAKFLCSTRSLRANRPPQLGHLPGTGTPSIADWLHR
jgi:hypothetical protein